MLGSHSNAGPMAVGIIMVFLVGAKLLQDSSVSTVHVDEDPAWWQNAEPAESAPGESRLDMLTLQARAVLKDTTPPRHKSDDPKYDIPETEEQPLAWENTGDETSTGEAIPADAWDFVVSSSTRLPRARFRPLQNVAINAVVQTHGAYAVPERTRFSCA